jgi:hypothetical protein
MSETPKFTVIDRRKFKAEEEQESRQQTAQTSPAEAPAPVETASPATPAPGGGPRLVVVPSAKTETEPPAEQESAEDEEAQAELPPAPSAVQSREQKMAYDASSQRLEDILRAQNPGMGPQPTVGFEHLVQQFYVSAMIQMGAGAQEGQRPRVDILGARTTIDLLGVLAEKTRGNLTETEDRALQGALFEVRMAFLELTSMISLQAMQPPQPPPPGKR